MLPPVRVVIEVILLTQSVSFVSFVLCPASRLPVTVLRVWTHGGGLAGLQIALGHEFKGLSWPLLSKESSIPHSPLERCRFFVLTAFA